MDVIDANDHILQSTFTATKSQDNIKAGLHSTVSYQERLVTKGRDRMFKHNLKLLLAKDAEIIALEHKGIFCCPFIDEAS